MRKKIFAIASLIIALATSLFAQAKLSRYDKLPFRQIDGVDSAGNPSRVYILGTIHLADDSICPVYQGYYDFVFHDRNEKGAPRISSILKEGGTAFLFAGIGHFVTEDSVFEFMRRDGRLFEKKSGYGYN
ncbi:MAG: TraB/GumN family protein [Treponemataceae bacterium]|nr:TraB/GumN family protein [Treponemataceae bacterium]